MSTLLTAAAMSAGSGVVMGLIKSIPNVVNRVEQLQTQSLIEYTNVTRVEPTVLFDDSLRIQPYMNDIFSSLVNIFAGYYLQAVAINCEVGEVSVKKVLKKLTTDRRIVDVQSNKENLLTRKYTEGIELIFQNPEELDKREKDLKKREEEYKEKEKKWNEAPTTSVKGISDLNINGNLSIGKTVEVVIESNGKKATIPVNIRLIVKEINSTGLVSFLTSLKIDRRLRTRWAKWRQGEISFFKDLVLCQDIIDEEKKSHYNDKSGAFKHLREKNRMKEMRLKDVIADEYGVNDASSIIVLSKETAEKIEYELGGRLDNFKIRENLFRLTYTMIALVVDVKWDKIVMYSRSIDEPSVLSVRDFKMGGGDKGPDINEILMAFRSGNVPTI